MLLPEGVAPPPSATPLPDPVSGPKLIAPCNTFGIDT